MHNDPAGFVDERVHNMSEDKLTHTSFTESHTCPLCAFFCCFAEYPNGVCEQGFWVFVATE